MDREAHQRRLDDLAPLERPRQRVALEPGDPRPQPDVHRRRVLGLQGAHGVERVGESRLAALEQALAGEQGAIELACVSGQLHPGSFPDHVTGTPAGPGSVRPPPAQAVVHARERRGQGRRADGHELRRADGRRRQRPLAAPALVGLPGGDQGLRRSPASTRTRRPTAASGTGCWSTCRRPRPSWRAARAAAASCRRARSTSATTTARRPGAAPRRPRATRRTATSSPCTRSTSKGWRSTRTSRPRSSASTSPSTRSRAA